MKGKFARKFMTTVSMVLFGVLLTGTVIANENTNQINDALGVTPFKIEETNASEKLEDKLYYKSDFKSVEEVVANGVKMADQVVAEGTVLLKNDNNALPLAKGAKVSLVGVGAYDPVYGGTGSGGISTALAVKYDASFRNAGLVLNEELAAKYNSAEWKQYKRSASGSYGNTVFKINEAPWSVVDAEAGSTFAQYGDAAIFVVSRRGGEGYDLNRPSDGIDKGDGIGTDYLGLNENEWSVLNGLKAKKKAGEIKKIICIINYSSMIEGDFIKDPDIDAALWAGAPGQGNNALGKIMVGDITPSGRLSDTMWMDNAKNPTNVNFGWWVYDNAESLGVSTWVGTKNYPEVTMASYMVYQEGVYNGYKYTETRYEDTVLGTASVGSYNYDEVVAYPFGYGLSYADFEVSNVNVEKTGERDYEVTATVTNTSKTYSGKYSVPVYVSKPNSKYAQDNHIQVPTVELINFEKTSELAPGASETVKIVLDEKYFASYDAYGAQGYILQDGDYYVSVGGSAHDAANNVLAAKKQNGVSIDESKMVGGKGDASMVKKFSLRFNRTKYAYSDVKSSTDGTVHAVKNLFDFADINRYEGRGNNHVDYYDRMNWNKVSLDQAEGHATLTMTEQMAREVYAQVPDESGVYGVVGHVPEKYKQEIQKDDVAYPTYGKTAGLQLIDMMYDDNGNAIDFFDPVWDTFMDQLTWEDTKALCSNGYHLTKGVASIGKPQTKDENGPNGLTRFNYRTYQNGLFYLYAKEAGKVDENGKLNQKDWDSKIWSAAGAGYACNGMLAATFNKDLAYKVGNAMGNEGVWGGWSGLYGTGLNIHRSAYLGRTSEYFSEDGMLSGLMGAMESKGIEEKGMHVYNKHCALNELESCRHGVQCWIPEQALREIYLRAFELPITMGGAFNTMASFSRFGTWAAGACNALAEGFLRGECGMKGVIVSDFYGDMNGNQNVDPYFEQVYACYVGACDIPDGAQPENEDHFGKYKEGYGKMAWAMRDSAKRLCYQTLWSNAMNGMSSSTKVIQITPWWQMLLYCLDILFATMFVAGLGWTCAALISEAKENK